MFGDMLQRYALVSHLLLACSIGHISTTVSGFYDIITRFLSNKTCVAILYNYCLMLFMFCCKIPVILFMGQLTRLEAEQLMESTRNYVMDTILFLVLSKPRFNGKEVLMSDLVKVITLLVSLKSFHTMLNNRLSHMFEVEVPRFLKILRTSTFIYFLSLINCFLLNLFLRNINKKNTFTIWIIFELFGMFQSLLFSTVKFIINLVDLYQPNGLVNKVTLIFYIELLHDMSSLVTFTMFMILFFVNNPINIPIYMVIDIIHVARNLSGRVKMLIEYRKLSKILNTRFPVATEDDLKREGTCIICRDSLDPTSRKIDCGHVFHLNCLKSWLFQHSSCPSCRAPINSSSTQSTQVTVDLNRILYNMEQRVATVGRTAYNGVRRVFRSKAVKRADLFFFLSLGSTSVSGSPTTRTSGVMTPATDVTSGSFERPPTTCKAVATKRYFYIDNSGQVKELFSPILSSTITTNNSTTTATTTVSSTSSASTTNSADDVVLKIATIDFTRTFLFNQYVYATTTSGTLGSSRGLPTTSRSIRSRTNNEDELMKRIVTLLSPADQDARLRDVNQKVNSLLPLLFSTLLTLVDTKHQAQLFSLLTTDTVTNSFNSGAWDEAAHANSGTYYSSSASSNAWGAERRDRGILMEHLKMLFTNPNYQRLLFKLKKNRGRINVTNLLVKAQVMDVIVNNHL